MASSSRMLAVAFRHNCMHSPCIRRFAASYSFSSSLNSLSSSHVTRFSSSSASSSTRSARSPLLSSSSASVASSSSSSPSSLSSPPPLSSETASPSSFFSFSPRSCEKHFDFRGLGAVLCDESLKDANLLKQARAHSTFLNLPLINGAIENINKSSLYEQLCRERLQFLFCVRFDRIFVSYLTYISNPNGKINIHASSPIGCDFTGDRMTLRRLHGQFDNSAPLIRAVRERTLVVDGTAGMGQDALMMAHNGCEVIMVESNPVLYLMLKDSLERCARMPGINEITSRMSVTHADTVQFLEKWRSPLGVPLTIYLDPFYPELHSTNRQKLKYTRTNQDIAFALRCSDWMEQRYLNSDFPLSASAVSSSRFHWGETFVPSPKMASAPSSSSSSSSSSSTFGLSSSTPSPLRCQVRELEPSDRCSGLGCLLQAAYTHANSERFRVVIKRPKSAPVHPTPRSWNSHSYPSRGTRYDVQSPPKLKS